MYNCIFKQVRLRSGLKFKLNMCYDRPWDQFLINYCKTDTEAENQPLGILLYLIEKTSRFNISNFSSRVLDIDSVIKCTSVNYYLYSKAYMLLQKVIQEPLCINTFRGPLTVKQEHWFTASKNRYIDFLQSESIFEGGLYRSY